MKTTVKVIAILAGAFITANVHAQSLNVNAGMSLNNFKIGDMETGSSTSNHNGATYTTSYKIKSVVNATYGLSYELNLGNRLSLETGGRFMTRGFNYTSDERYDNGAQFYEDKEYTRYKINYIDVPITLNTAITTGELRTYVRTGIYAGYMMSSKYTIRAEGRDSDGYNYSDEYSSSEMEFEGGERFTGGIQIGAGASYKQFYFETNYNIGQFNLDDFDSGISTRDLTFTLGYKIKFNKK